MSDHTVTELDGTRRSARPNDAMLHVNDDGTVTIPADVQVFEYHNGILAFRSPHLRGWANLNPYSPIVFEGGRRFVRDAVLEELARQGRELGRLP